MTAPLLYLALAGGVSLTPSGMIDERGELFVSSSMSSVAELADRLRGHSTRLAELRALRAGWDGRNAPAPNDAALACARRVLAALATASLPANRISADVEGGIVVYLFGDELGKRFASFSCSNDGELVALRVREGQPPEADDIEHDRELDAAIEAARELTAEGRART